MSNLKSLTRRPEFAAFIGTLFVFLFFSWFGRPTFTTPLVTAGWLNVAAELGLIALPVALVMVAGHLDLSVGSILAAGAMTYAIITGYFKLPDLIGLPAGLAVGTFFGYLNGLIVTKTKLSSFIVTLAMNFGLRGLVFGITRLTTSTVLVSVEVSETVRGTFGGRIFPSMERTLNQLTGSEKFFLERLNFDIRPFSTFENVIVIWAIMAIIVSWILYKTKYGNWIFALGGDETFARAAGVPVEKVTIGLFMGSGFGAALLGVSQVALFGSAQVSAGQSYVFFSIVAVVVGGVLLTGGYGSPVGVIFGTLTFAIVSQGIYSTGWDSDWSSLILGLLLLIAVFTNNTFRRLALSGDTVVTKNTDVKPTQRIEIESDELNVNEEATND
ncbi:MAG: ABC transporter permease [Anaerolineaceae bacterium]|nr:ABC transporter permease [Anaerolineaceae bacterium]